MQVVPKAATQQSSPQPTSNATDARQRAIARLTEQPVPDANNVSVEELGAIRQKAAPQTTEVVETEATTEAPAPETTEAKDPLSTQYALLARKEKALRAKVQQQEQAIKAREEALKAREEALSAKDQEYSSNYISKQRLKEQTLEALEEAQVSYDEVTQKLIDRQNPIDARTQSLLSKMEAKIAKLESELETGKKASVEQQTSAYQAAVKQIETDVRALVTTDPAFETVKATGSVKDVVELIEATYKEEGKLLSVEEATQMVEDHLLSEIDKLIKIEKVKSRYQQKPAVSASTQAQPPAKPTQQQQTMKTLTNATGTTRTLSAKERAIMAFKGELK